MAVQKHPVATEKFREMDKKRWLVRYLVLASIAVILGIKLYLLIYVVDFTVGFYSFLTSFVLFNIFFLSWVKYRDPFTKVKDVIIPEDRKPLVSIIVPVKNEEGTSGTVFNLVLIRLILIRKSSLLMMGVLIGQLQSWMR